MKWDKGGEFEEEVYTIEEAKECLRTIPSINSGGCLIAAYAFYLFCKNKLQKDIKLVALNDNSSDDRHESNKRYLEGNSLNFDIPAHFAWKFGDNGRLFDSEGIVRQDWQYSLDIPNESVHEYCRKALNTKDWNHSFNREKWVPYIEEILGVKLEYA